MGRSPWLDVGSMFWATYDRKGWGPARIFFSFFSIEIFLFPNPISIELYVCMYVYSIIDRLIGGGDLTPQHTHSFVKRMAWRHE